jgi:hypothetical protein
MYGSHGTPSSQYVFPIDADIQEILRWWDFERPGHNIISSNCGDITQAFLEKFAQIPKPCALAAPFTLNHLALVICLPSFLPMGITLPGRILDHAKFHVEARINPQIITQYQTGWLKLGVALSIALLFASIAGIAAAVSVLSGALIAPTLVASLALGAGSSYGFFKCVNRLALVEEAKTHLKPQAA